MIAPNTEHPDFRHSGELLLLLPPEPIFAPVSDVKADMDCDGYMVGQAIAGLRRAGIRVLIRGSGAHKELALSRETLRLASHQAETYCRAVYGE